LPDLWCLLASHIRHTSPKGLHIVSTLREVTRHSKRRAGPIVSVRTNTVRCMTLVRKVARWGLVAVLVLALGLAVLHVTGALAPTYRWFARYFAPDVWSALAAWVAVAVGIATVIVAGSYAKQQVEKAQDQVREAQAARLAQERQAQNALETQVRLANEALIAQAKLTQETLEHDAAQAQKIRQEQAQPNVVLYTEMNPYVKQFLEIVLKNFGTTPAYNVKVAVTPALKATSDVPGEKLIDVRIPEFPILAPGQEWRTSWDYSVGRKEYQEKWKRMAETPESDLTPNEQLEKQYWLTRRTDDSTSEQRLQDLYLASIHTATVTYRDSNDRLHETAATLDSDIFKGTTWVDIKTVHNLTKMLENRLDTQNKGLDAIHRRLAEFGTEHEGVWIYGSGDKDEREYRKNAAVDKGRRRGTFQSMIDQARQRGRQRRLEQDSTPQTDSETPDEQNRES
jgi:hypothetical protein